MRFFLTFFLLLVISCGSKKPQTEQDQTGNLVIRSIPFSGSIRSIAYGNNKYVAVGSNGTVLNSFDGITWKKVNLAITTNFLSIAFGNGQFVAVGSTPIATTIISSDGSTWSINVNEHRFSHIAYGNGNFVANTLVLGVETGLYISKDANIWKKTFFSNQLCILALTYGNGQFLAAVCNMFESQGSEIRMLCSSNGLQWQTINPITDSCGVSSVACGNDRYVAVGYPITEPMKLGGVILSSYNKTNWSKTSPGLFPILSSVAYGNKHFLTVGNGAFLLSSDGFHWAPIGHVSENLNGVFFCKDKFIAAGDSNIYLYSPRISDN